MEVLFIDNASVDDSIDYIRENYQDTRVKILRNSRNLGVGEGYNVGMRASNGEYIVQLNNDIIVDPNWLKELVQVMKNNPRIGIAGCKILVYGKENIIAQIGSKIGRFGDITNIGYHEKDEGQYDEIRYDFDYLLGASVIYRKEVIDRIGGHDPEYFMYFEELDICTRARAMGYEIAYVPHARVWHKHQATTKKLDPSGRFRYYMYNRSKYRFFIKFMELKRLLPALAINIVKQIGLFICSVIRLKPKIHFLSPILWNIYNIRSTWKKRVEVKKI
jgi:GT2 family glycosyltransferase